MGSSREPRVWAAVVAAVAIVVGGCAAGAGSPSNRSRGAADGLPTGRFEIVGRRIYDPDGRRFYPIGANVAVRQGRYEHGYTFNWNGTATGRSADVAAWGWNTVRANLVCLPPGDPSTADLDAGIDDLIDEYTARRIVVMVECHDLTGRNPRLDDSSTQRVLGFWDRLATRWRNNPYVWFNPFNEPVSHGGAAANDAWLALQRGALTRIRAIAPDNVFVADLPRYGQGVEALTGADSVTRLGAGRHNVLYSWHAYGAVGVGGAFGRYEDNANEAASRADHEAVLRYAYDHDIPLVIGEFGDPLTLGEGSAGPPIWNRIGARAVMDLAPRYEVGLLWWHATGDSNNSLTYSLMADRHRAPWSAAGDGNGLSDGGRRFWNVSKNPPALQP
ncbi:MAG: cellulase family glycosylhydrolase [Microthrixaceae bacterium]